MYGATVN